MKNKWSFVWGMIIGILATVLVVVGYKSIATIILTEEKFSSSENVAPSSKQANQKIIEIEKLINNRFLHNFNANNLTESMYAGMVDGLDDEYSYYFTKEEYEKAMESLSGHYQGIGIILVLGKESPDVMVGHVYEGSPAEKAGVKVDDTILTVDGKELTGMLLEAVANLIREGESPTTTITLIREGEKEPLSLTIEKGDIEVRSVNSKMLPDKVGYITIFQFTQSTAIQFEEDLRKLEAEGMERVLVDLRDNPGGSLTGVCDTLKVFMPKGLLVYSEDNQGERIEYESSGKNPIDIPMAVLINDKSASASEIFAGAVQDHQVGTLIGTTTFGKGVVQSIFNLSDGSGVKLTTSQYFTPNGIDIHGKGISPDVIVEQPEEQPSSTDKETQDVQLDKAIEIIKTK